MYGQAPQLVAFRLMPLERSNQAPPVAKWSHDIIDRTHRLVASTDQSLAPITHWEWGFEDGETSTEANPVHQYKSVGKYGVVLRVKGPTGESKLSKVWDVAFQNRRQIKHQQAWAWFSLPTLLKAWNFIVLPSSEKETSQSDPSICRGSN